MVDMGVDLSRSPKQLLPAFVPLSTTRAQRERQLLSLFLLSSSSLLSPLLSALLAPSIAPYFFLTFYSYTIPNTH